jgi:hypothetical protein
MELLLAIHLKFQKRHLRSFFWWLKYKGHTIYHFSCLKIYSMVVWEHSSCCMAVITIYFPKGSSHAITPTPLAVPQPLAATHLLSALAHLPILDISHEWNHTLFVLPCLSPRCIPAAGRTPCLCRLLGSVSFTLCAV